MSVKYERLLRLAMTGILLTAMFLTARQGAAVVSLNQEGGNRQRCVVIDAGHGGADPGKVGINGELEKDINLEIARDLESFLKAEGLRVVMTREDENGLYEEGASNKKVRDMKRRLEIIEEADPVLVVSIHQNSYHQEEVKGAQVFYYATSDKSRLLAETLQEQLRQLEPENHRQAKGNDSYFLLKKRQSPLSERTAVFCQTGRKPRSFPPNIIRKRLLFAFIWESCSI